MARFKKTLKILGLLFCGFLIGVVVLYFIAANAKIQFLLGDCIVIEEDAYFGISKDDYEFITLLKDSSGDIEHVAVTDGDDMVLFSGIFEGNKLVEIIVGNGIFGAEYSRELGLWHQANYFGWIDTEKEELKEIYTDIDFDGHLDKMLIILDEKTESVSKNIFVNNNWLRVKKWNDSDDRRRLA